MMRRFGGHLGTTVSALVDGQLDAETTERAWDHVLSCSQCRGLVEREAWIKRRLSTMCGNEPSARLLGSLQSLQGLSAEGSPTWEGLEAWAEVDRLESQTRHRRRTGFAVAGAGSVAVLGFAALGSFGLGGPSGPPITSIGSGTPTSTPTSAVLPTVAEVHGRLQGWRVPVGSRVATAVPLIAAE
ncbi:MAG TPA: hypothetical protein VLI04_05795 [Nocardioidaceae bacterium]|nr:hypothetical protein [Nocardioidaceae bacterium]